MNNTIPRISSRPTIETSESEYFDVIDVVGFLWRSKFWILAGIFLGAGSTFSILSSKKYSNYVTLVPLSISSSDKNPSSFIMGEINRFLDKPEVRKSFEDKIADDSWRLTGLFPVRAIMIGTSSYLEITSSESDSSGQKALELAQLTKSAIEKFNESQSPANKPPAPNSGAKPALKTELERQFSRLIALQNAEEGPYKIQLFALESRLAQLSGLRASSTVVVGTNPSFGDDVLRMLGAAKNKISADEQAQILQEYGRISGEIRAIQMKYDQPIKDLGSRFISFSGSILDSINADSLGIAAPNLDEKYYRALVNSGKHESNETKRPLFLAIGIVLGGLFGLMAFSLRVFIKDHGTRLRAILKN